jgi:hypothetical protein
MLEEEKLTVGCDSCSNCKNVKEEEIKEGDFVKVLITGEIGMIVNVYDYIKNQTYRKVYQVRLSNYQVVKFYDFEVERR